MNGRSTLRKIYSTQLEGYKTDHMEFNASMTKASKDFYRMMELPADAHELTVLIEKYEKWQEEYYDPAMVVGIP
jgi:hypothetical protein